MSIKKLQRPVDSVFANFSKGSAKFMDLELSDSEIQELQQKGLSVEVLDKFDKGGNVFPYKSPLKPYVPKSVEDHLYRKGMYADSLSLYNAHVFQKNSWKPGSEEFLTKHGGSKEDIKKLRAQRSSMIATHGRNFIGFNYATYNSKNLASPGQSYPVMPSEQVIVDKYKELIKHNPSSFKIGYYSSPDLWHKSIKPIGTYIDGDFSPIYKKPVQEIADVNTGDSLPVKSVLNFPRSYPELAVSNFDGVKKSLPTPYSMSGRQQTVLTWNPELKRHDETVRVQDDAFIKDKEEWEDNSQPVVYYNPETKEYNDKPFVFNYEGRNQTYNFKTGGPLNPSTEEDGTAYTYNNKNYKKDGNGKWSVDVNGTYMPLVEGDVAARSNLLNKQAQPVQMYGKPKMPSTTREYPLPTIVGDNTKTVLPKQAVNQINNSMYMSSPEYIAEQKAKEKQLADFKKSKWEKYEKGTFSDKALDRVQSAMVDPLGMASRFMLGEQAYIPGMGKGLLNHDSPEYSDYLEAVGYTPGKFEVSDVQNILNPMNWGASAGNQLNKGNYATGTAEALLAFTGVGGVGKNALRGAKLLGKDLEAAKLLAKKPLLRGAEFLTTKTPLKNPWKLNPKAYQYNLPENAMFRGIAEEGARDATQAGVFRPHTFNLERSTTKNKKKMPSFDDFDMGSGLTLRNNPSRVKNVDNILGKNTPIKSVLNKETRESIELKTWKDADGELYYYMSANMPSSKIKAGKAYLEIEKHIPKGASILENTSLSYDSFLNILKQTKNPKFESFVKGTIPMNNSAKHAAFKVKPKETASMLEYAHKKHAEEAVNELNLLLNKYNLPNASVTKEYGNYSIELPNIGLKKLYSIIGLSLIYNNTTKL